MTASSPAILINHHPASINGSGVTSTRCNPNRQAAEANDCVIHCSAHHHHHNSHFSPIQSEGSIFPRTLTNNDSKTFYVW
ncbi:hypothetical protein TNCV_2898371 [Trichonephila clavipes]|nr:hypothetical protein TNCV_2898371 [Trichonephila clavipes]